MQDVEAEDAEKDDGCVAMQTGKVIKKTGDLKIILFLSYKVFKLEHTPIFIGAFIMRKVSSYRKFRVICL